jgi:hypothetical protein
MKRLSWKYIAGLVDGEACLDVQVTRGIYVRPRLRICLADNCKFILDILHANHGGVLSARESTNSSWQSSTSWELCGYSLVCPFLRNFANHTYIKREQAKFLLSMETTVKGKQIAEQARLFIRDELKAMKRDPHRLSEKAQEKLILLL